MPFREVFEILSKGIQIKVLLINFSIDFEAHGILKTVGNELAGIRPKKRLFKNGYFLLLGHFISND